MNEVTLQDVARRAGVSVATVSRVLHQNGYASDRTRERVETALRESGYRLNAVAQGLRTRSTITLGIILHGGLSNPFFAEIAMGAEQAAADLGFNVLLFNARGDVEQERKSVETLLRRRVDGILFATALHADNVQLVADAGVPAVEIEHQLCDDVASVVVDNYAGAKRAMEHLIGLGHRQIGYIGEPFLEPNGDEDGQDDAIRRARFEAYRDSLDRAGLPLDPANTVRARYPREEGGWGSIAAGAAYMRDLLAQSNELTAVFAISDILASGAMQTLYAEGIRVPDEMSVVGFDDTFAPYLAPPLTTVVQPMFEMGFRAATLAIQMVTEPGHTATVTYCPTELVVRSSTAPRA